MKQIKKRFIPIIIVLQILITHLTYGFLEPRIDSKCAVKVENYRSSIHATTRLYNFIETSTDTLFALGDKGAIYEKRTIPTASVGKDASTTIAKTNSYDAFSYYAPRYPMQQLWTSQILLSNTEESKKNIASFYDVVTTRTTKGLEMNLLLRTNSFLRIPEGECQQVEDLNNINQGV